MTGFNGAVVLHDGQGRNDGLRHASSIRFNGAVVLHDGQADRRAALDCGIRASTEPSFFTTDKVGRRAPIPAAHPASTEPSFFTTDKSSTSTSATPVTLLQRSRRSSRRTRWAARCTTLCTARCFNGAVVLHDGQVEVNPRRHSRLRDASTEPSFFTTDKAKIDAERTAMSQLQRSRRSSRRTSGDPRWDPQPTGHCASTEPSFFTTDKASQRDASSPHLPASTEPSFFTTDKLSAKASVAPQDCQLQRSRRSSRRTSKWVDVLSYNPKMLQRSRRSSRRTR